MDVCRTPSKALPKLCSAWLSNLKRPDIDVREGRHARYDRWQVLRAAGHASIERRRAAAIAPVMFAS